MTIEAVTFDFWSTLVREDPDLWDLRLAAWHRILEDAGYPRETKQIMDAFGSAWHAYIAAWHGNERFAAPDALAVMVVELGLDPEPKLTAALLAVITDPPADRHPLLNEHIIDCLGTLRSAGVRLGIICDVGLTPSRVLRRYLDQQGALEYFDHWSFSDEVGVFKPDARIFTDALAGLGGIDPTRAAHVGDLRRTDILGAKAMGMTAIRYAGVNDDPPIENDPLVEGDHVTTDHAEIPALLGLA